MQPINRNVGITPSEALLARLADQTFLDLWSYPNTFADRRSGGKGDGKEICDLLVVCGDDVIIFSDKSIAWPAGDNLALNWKRWYKRAITKSVAQIRGAERWLRQHPDRVFLDAACEKPLPIGLPAPSRMRVHGVAVALGTHDACSKYHKDRDGSLLVVGETVGEQHTDTDRRTWMPFAIGDVAPEGSFIHVFDEVGLSLVMREMDTIIDFIEYLTARASGIRYGPIGMAGSEADLVAVYAQSDLGDGRHGFSVPDGGNALQIPRVGWMPGHYREYRGRPEYSARAEANRISYQWDRLIRLFTAHVMAGTSVAVAGVEPTTQTAEFALRAMALEDRTNRRVLGEAFSGALAVGEASGQDRYARVVVRRDGSHDPGMGYVFLIMAFREDWLVAQGYDYYRDGRAGMLRAYCEVALLRYPGLTRMLGIAIDASEKLTGRPGGSEDLMLVEVKEWTDEHRAQVEALAEATDILRPERLQEQRFSTYEYPGIAAEWAPAQLSRQQRRAAERAEKKRQR